MDYLLTSVGRAKIYGEGGPGSLMPHLVLCSLQSLSDDSSFSMGNGNTCLKQLFRSLKMLKPNKMLSNHYFKRA